MNSCSDCSRLENRLHRANDYYVRLILLHDRMTRDGDAETAAFEDAMQEAQSERTSAALELLAHRGTHEHLPRPRQQQQRVHVLGQRRSW